MTPIRRNLIRRVLLGLVVLGTLFLTSCELITGAVGSTDNSLLSLSIKDNNNHSVVLSPGFSHSIKSYTAEVSSDVTSVSVNAIATDGKARVVVLGADANLVEGENTIQVIVTAENGKKASYVVTITRRHEPLGTLVVSNLSGYEVWYLYVLPDGESTWSDDLLGDGGIIPDGGSWSYDLAPGTYHLWAETDGDVGLYWETLNPITIVDGQTYTWELYP